MNKKSTVLIVHNYYQIPGGEDTVVTNEKQLLEKHGHKVFLYNRYNSELNTMPILLKIFFPLMSIFNIRTYKEVKHFIKEKKIDIVHVHNTQFLISPSVYYAALAKKVPVIQTIHNFRLLCPCATFYRNNHICEDCLKYGIKCAIKYGCYRNSRIQTFICVINTLFHRMTRIYSKINFICLTSFNKNKLIYLKQINPKNIYVKPNFIESTDIFIPEEERLNRFIFAGRLDKLKGIDILFEAWKKMGNHAPKLIVCGTGPMEHWCQNFVEMNNINIELKGFVNNKEIRNLLAYSKALVLPTQWYEGFPMSIIEAYSVGTPVVCSNIGNAGDIVKENVTGCKFEPDSTDELIRAVRRCNGLCKSTLSEYQKMYTADKNYEELIHIYSEIIK